MAEPTQRRFAVMGDNTFKIANKLMSNPTICRLLKYQTKDPLKSIDPVTGKEAVYRESKEEEKDVIAEERDRFFNIINRIEKLYD